MSEKQTTTRKKPGRKPKAAPPVERDKAEEPQAAPAAVAETGYASEPSPPAGGGSNETAEADNGNSGDAGESGAPDNGLGQSGGDLARMEPNAPAAEGWTVARVLKITKPLMKGEDVKALQAALIARGYHCGPSGASGIYERNTAYAVRCFQAANRLIVDGKAGRFTVAALGGTWNG